jgi:hypothetical protein
MIEQIFSSIKQKFSLSFMVLRGDYVGALLGFVPFPLSQIFRVA